jgi:threonine/homoserine/homoserine lactone efflux protein
MRLLPAWAFLPLLLSSATALSAVKYAGAAYLFYLAGLEMSPQPSLSFDTTLRKPTYTANWVGHKAVTTPFCYRS